MMILFSHRQYLMCIRVFAQSTLRRLPFNHTYMHTLEVIKTSPSQRVGMSSMFLASYDRDTQICPWYIQNISHWSKHTTDLQYLVFQNYPHTLSGVVKEYLNDFRRLGKFALLPVGWMWNVLFLPFIGDRFWLRWESLDDEAQRIHEPFKKIMSSMNEDQVFLKLSILLFFTGTSRVVL